MPPDFSFGAGGLLAQSHCWLLGIPAITCFTCWPQPDHVVFLQRRQVTGLHMRIFSFLSSADQYTPGGIKAQGDQEVTVALSEGATGTGVGTGVAIGFGVQNLVYFGAIAGKERSEPLPS